MARVALVWLCAVVCLAGCAAVPQRFPLRHPMWVDDDQHPFAPRPDEQYNASKWEGFDETFFRPTADLWLYETERPALNVNSWDEVPSSSWYQNRLSRHRMSPEELARGACGDHEPAPRPWSVIEPKPEGSNPGVMIEAADGHRYMFKIDNWQDVRPTAADAIATRIFHAAGYYVPCNEVVSFTAEDFVIPDGAEVDPAELQSIIDQAGRQSDGLLRGSLSRFVEGSPLGGWRFAGTRSDDLNDVVAHQHRREVRALYVLSSWVNHIDVRAGNNFDAWIEVDGTGRGYVRHYALDVGDSFGIVWPESPDLSRRFGNAYYFDIADVGVELFSLGIAGRDHQELIDVEPHPIFGFYDVERFEPDDWHPGYPNEAFEQMTERDAAWMARIIARFRQSDLRAVASVGRFVDPAHEDMLVRILRGRQRKVLERYLTKLSPLAHPELSAEDAPVLCLEDLAVTAGLRSRSLRSYRARLFPDWPRPGSNAVFARNTDDGACVALPDLQDYVVVELVASTRGLEATGAVEVHMRGTERGRYQIVGLRRREP